MAVDQRPQQRQQALPRFLAARPARRRRFEKYRLAEVRSPALIAG